MRMWKLLTAALVVSAGVKIAAMAQSAPPAAQDPAKMKLFEPYNLLTDLTADQKSKIEDIHKTEMAAEKKLRDGEHDDIMAVLSDTQKKELDDAMSKQSVEKRATSAERRAAAEEEKAQQLRDKAGSLGATTQP